MVDNENDGVLPHGAVPDSTTTEDTPPESGIDDSDRPWLVETDRTACIGTGICVGSMPAVFALSDGRSKPLQPHVAPDDELIDIVDLCPMGAIRVLERATGRVIAPAEEDD